MQQIMLIIDYVKSSYILYLNQYITRGGQQYIVIIIIILSLSQGHNHLLLLMVDCAEEYMFGDR